MKAIKYCPLCGKEAKIFFRDIPPYDSKVYGVSCMYCTARVFGYSLPEVAVEAWNRRVDNDGEFCHPLDAASRTAERRSMNEERKRVCCNCGNNIRYPTKDGIRCRCAIDNHHIDYLQCFEHWCRRWKKDRKWDEENAAD